MWFGNLQVGRIAAATMVLAFHAACHGRAVLGAESSALDPVPAYYFRTSIVFLFALSGFVLTHCLQSGSLGGFVGFRLLRLFPAYWAAVAVTIVAQRASGFVPPAPLKDYVRAMALWPAGPGRVSYTLGIEWTLVYELYLSMAIVPLAAVGRRRGLAIGAGVWLACCLAHQAVRPGGVVVFPVPSQLPLSVVNVPFLLGVLTYLGRDRWPRAGAKGVFVGAVALAGGAVLTETDPGWSFVLQAVAAASLVGWLAGAPQVGRGHPLATAGDWSYGVYLLHVPVMVAVLTAVRSSRWEASGGAAMVFAGVVALAVSSAYGHLEWAVYRRVRRMMAGAVGDQTLGRPLHSVASSWLLVAACRMGMWKGDTNIRRGVAVRG